MIPRFVGYYTRNSSYEREARGLIESLDALKIRHDIAAVDPSGDWQANTQAKARLILDMLNKYRGEPLVYNDVDAFVIHKPTLFDGLDCDIAAAMFAGHTLASGTIFLGGTEKTAAVVRKWCELCEKYPRKILPGVHPKFPSGCDAWDQRVLHLAIIQMPDVRFFELPPEYCYMIGLTQKQNPDISPIILHTRGALRFQDAIDEANQVRV